MERGRTAANILRGALVGLLLATAACDDPTCAPNAPCLTPTARPNVCTNISGSRNVFWSDTCGRSGSGVLVLAQSACQVTGSLAGLGTFAGTVSGSTFSFTLTFTNPCAGTATGTATMPSGSAAFNGSYTGTQSGGGNCCTPVTGTLSFDFAPTRPPTTVTPGPSGTPVSVTPTVSVTATRTVTPTRTP